MIRPLLAAVVISLSIGWLVTEMFTQIAYVKVHHQQQEMQP